MIPKSEPDWSRSTEAAKATRAEMMVGVVVSTARLCNAAALESFIARGANVNEQDDEGMTALHHAAARGARPCIRVLVACPRTDYLIKDKLGRYAFELAIEGARDYAVSRLLRRKQVKQAIWQKVPAYVPRD